MNKNEIKNCFVSRALPEEARAYLDFHSQRYAALLQIISALKNDFPEKVKILDIGPSYLTELLIKSFPAGSVSCLGLGQEGQYRGGHFPEAVELTGLDHFFEFNLNESANQSFPLEKKFDLIIFAEVLEHLLASPNTVLKFIAGLMNEGGYLILQTPNASVIDKRVAMFRGINPFEPLRADQANPGHFREYTAAELFDFLFSLGFKNIKIKYFNYPAPKPKRVVGKALDHFYKVSKIIFPKLRDGITIVATNRTNVSINSDRYS